MQEVDRAVSDYVCGGTLLGLPQERQLERVGVRIIRAGVAAGAAHKLGHGAPVGPARNGRRRPEVGVVRVRHDDQKTIGPVGMERRLDCHRRIVPRPGEHL